MKIIYNGKIIATGRTNTFTVPASSSFVINQKALTRGEYHIPQNNQIIKLKDYNLDVDRIEGLKNKIMATGRLPSGKYEFFIEAVNPRGVSVGSESQPSDNFLFITNPTNVQLIFPGSPAGDPNIPTINTLYPYLQWQSDANIFNIFVYKKLATDRNVQDVLSHPPVLYIRNFIVPENQRQYLFQYPTTTSPLRFSIPAEFQPIISTSGSVGPIRMLEPGNVYYWYVEGIVPTGGGTFQTIKSEVFQFRIQQQTPTSASNQQIGYLLRTLGSESLLHQLRFMQEQGFTPTGKIRWNGRDIDMTEFMRLLNEMRAKNYRIQKITIY